MKNNPLKILKADTNKTYNYAGGGDAYGSLEKLTTLTAFPNGCPYTAASGQT